VNTQEVNTTIHAIQQNLPCDPLTIFNGSSTLVRCIDTTPVYIFTVVAQTFSGAMNLQRSMHFVCVLLAILQQS
jgi:hypothetical protein